MYANIILYYKPSISKVYDYMYIITVYLLNSCIALTRMDNPGQPYYYPRNGSVKGIMKLVHKQQLYCGQLGQVENSNLTVKSWHKFHLLQVK